MVVKKKRGRPRKVVALPKRVHSNISEEHQARLEKLLAKYPNLIVHEIMEIGINYLSDTLTHRFG